MAGHRRDPVTPMQATSLASPRATNQNECREAVKRVLTNPELIEEGKKTRRFLAYQPPKEAREITCKVLRAVTPEQQERLRQVIFKAK